MPENNPKYTKEKQSRAWAVYLGMALQMAAVIAAGVYGGQQIDKQFNTGFWVIILSLLGVGMSIYILIRTATRQ